MCRGLELVCGDPEMGGGVESGCVGPEQGFGDLELPGQGTLFLFTSGNVASQVYSKHSGAGL